jgi:hypothetical protein
MILFLIFLCIDIYSIPESENLEKIFPEAKFPIIENKGIMPSGK